MVLDYIWSGVSDSYLVNGDSIPRAVRVAFNYPHSPKNAPKLDHRLRLTDEYDLKASSRLRDTIIALDGRVVEFELQK